MLIRSLKRIIRQHIDSKVTELMVEAGLKNRKLEEEVKKDAY